MVKLLVAEPSSYTTCVETPEATVTPGCGCGVGLGVVTIVGTCMSAVGRAVDVGMGVGSGEG